MPSRLYKLFSFRFHSFIALVTSWELSPKYVEMRRFDSMIVGIFQADGNRATEEDQRNDLPAKFVSTEVRQRAGRG